MPRDIQYRRLDVSLQVAVQSHFEPCQCCLLRNNARRELRHQIRFCPFRFEMTFPTRFSMLSTSIVLTSLPGLACWSHLSSILPLKKAASCDLFIAYAHISIVFLVATIHLTSSPRDRPSFWEKDYSGSLHNHSRTLLFGICLFMLTCDWEAPFSSFFTHRSLINGEPRSMFRSTSGGDFHRVCLAIGYCRALGNRE